MRINFIIILLLCGFSSTAQFTDEFEDGNLEINPIWLGDLENFITNTDEMLQLNASEAGQSFLYTQTKYEDSLEINIDLKMDFSPSGSNFSRIYFLIDQVDLSTSNGYFINLGKNGSDDNIEFYKLENGNEILLSSGVSGTIANDPATVKLKITKQEQNKWTIFTSYDGNLPVKEFELLENSYPSSSGKYFGIFCKYTGSRADKFIFDNIGVNPFFKDLDPPKLLSAKFIDEYSIQLSFDEALDMETGTNLDNYNIQGVGKPNMALLNSNNNQVLLEFNNEFQGSVDYSIEVSGIKDLAGNILEGESADLSFISGPKIGDLLISEILFNPFPGEQDFIEIYNSSDKKIELQGMIIRNESRDENKVFGQSYVMDAKSYLAISEDVEALKTRFAPISSALFIVSDLPSFNNDSGNLSLMSKNREVLDAFDYQENMHSTLISNNEGKSLERLSFETPTSEPSNWSSAGSTVNFATPGYKNSNSITLSSNGNDYFTTINRIFSPNGVNNKYLLSYNLKKGGFIGNIDVYDSDGYRIKKIMSNQLLGSQGIISWDGTDDDGNSTRLGIYLIIGDVFNEFGEVIAVKKTCVLANPLD